MRSKGIWTGSGIYNREYAPGICRSPLALPLMFGIADDSLHLVRENDLHFYRIPYGARNDGSLTIILYLIGTGFLAGDMERLLDGDLNTLFEWTEKREEEF